MFFIIDSRENSFTADFLRALRRLENEECVEECEDEREEERPPPFPPPPLEICFYWRILYDYW